MLVARRTIVEPMHLIQCQINLPVIVCYLVPVINIHMVIRRWRHDNVQVIWLHRLRHDNVQVIWSSRILHDNVQVMWSSRRLHDNVQVMWSSPGASWQCSGHMIIPGGFMTMFRSYDHPGGVMTISGHIIILVASW